LLAGIALGLSLESYSPLDPSWNTASPHGPQNLLGYPGAYFADLVFQLFGFGAVAIPILTLLLGWKWIRSEPVAATRLVGLALLLLSVCAALSVRGISFQWKETAESGGLAGRLVTDLLVAAFNSTGALIVISAWAVRALSTRASMPRRTSGDG